MLIRDRTTILIWAACGLLVLFMGGRWFLAQQSGEGFDPRAGGGVSPAAKSETSPGAEGGTQGSGAPGSGGDGATGVAAEVVVDVSGKVRRPGVYRLPKGARVYEAIRMAGGALRRADRGSINLAALVVDGSQINVGGPAGAIGGSGTGPEGSQGPVSLSSATAEQLDGLDGIGPALAQRIIEWRSAHGGFKSVAELDQVSGIGPAKLESLRSQVVP